MNERSYFEDRAEIENLHARYMFALDFLDADTYASTFTEDGELDWAFGLVKGREAIRGEIATRLPALYAEAAFGPHVRPRHMLTNIVLKVEGDRATGKASWFQMSNDGPDNAVTIGGYGHYDDELVRVNGAWLFKRRRINAVLIPGREGPDKNPAW